jgi:hypothetical protein
VVPEHTVATGAAATREWRSPDPGSREAETAKLPDEPGPRSRRALLIGAGVMALVLVAALVALIAGNGGDGGSASGDTSTAATTKEPKAKPKPQTLTKAELIRKGDAICTDSQGTFKGYQSEFPAGEVEASVGYSRLLANISNKAVRRFNELTPPTGLQQPYEAYVKAQEEVAGWDQDALRAAEDEDQTAYDEAREMRNGTQEERERLADAVGFKVCSQ